MAIDMRKVEPLSSKSVLLEQALKRHQMQARGEGGYEDTVAKEFDWLIEDKAAIKGLVKQMDASIGDLAYRMRDVERLSEKSHSKIEREQQLLFKQIKTLNGLLKSQVDTFARMERDMVNLQLEQSSIMPQIGVGVFAGFVSAMTIIVTAPWVQMLIDKLA